MRVYLVQHGEAAAKEVDASRPLTARGHKEVEAVAAFLKPLGVEVEAVWHSGKVRAVQTAELLAGAVTTRQGVVAHDGLGPKEDVTAAAEELLRLNKDVFVVGHLPFLSRLASLLLCGESSAGVVRFQYGGVVCLTRDEEGGWAVRWMVTPEAIGC